MDILWAPWRIGYIKGEKPEGCVFCTKLEEGRDAENFILFRGERCFVILNLYPYNNGHLMVVPYAHVPGIEDLPAETLSEMTAITQRALGLLRERMRPSGFNMGINQGVAAGAGVADHVHMHVVPRWIGDTNFMSSLSDTRVMAQSLESCYAMLVDGFQAAPPAENL